MEGRMKSSTKGFLIGLVCGAILLVCFQIFSVIGLSLLFSSGTGKQWMADLMLSSPRFPDPDALSELGQADYGWAIQTLDGETVPFSNFQGQTVFLNIWASWCSPCAMEMPSIEKLHQSVDPSLVAFVILSREDRDVVRAFVERQPLDLPLYIAEELPSVFESSAVPATFIIDPAGRIVFKHMGAVKWDGAASEAFLRDVGG